MAQDYRNLQPPIPRGLRNNNPGNIRDTDPWMGKVGYDSDGFIIFADMTWGIRATIKALTNMINRGVDTIATLIPTWSMTDQAAYVSNVSAYTGIDQNTQLGTDQDTLKSLSMGIFQQELGGQFMQYVTADDFASGMQMATGGVAATASTVVQAAAVEVQNNPAPYIIGGVLVLLIISMVTKKKT